MIKRTFNKNSDIGKALISFEPKHWVILLEKCKTSKLDNSEIISANKGDRVVISAKNKELLEKFLFLIKKVSEIK